jgi:hypothetical protein
MEWPGAFMIVGVTWALVWMVVNLIKPENQEKGEQGK